MIKVVFYGVGDYLRRHWHELKVEYHPVALCDENQLKQGYSEEYSLEVMSLEKVELKYPGAFFYVSIKNGVNGRRLEIIDSLINKGITKDRILNYENYYNGYGCPLASTGLFFHHDRIMNCCENPEICNAPFATYEGDNTLNLVYDMKTKVMENVSRFEILRTPKTGHSKLYEKNSNGQWEYTIGDSDNRNRSAYCKHCHEIKKGYYSKEHFVIDYMQVAANSDSVCNFKCPYCCEAMPGYVPKHDSIVTANIINTLRLLKTSRDRIEFNDDGVHFCIATGEPALWKDFDKVMEEVPKAYYQVLSNASIYSDSIERAIANGELVMSLDSGTRETFKKVKGLDCFDKVLENLKKYRKHGSIVPKFIIQPGVNDNEKDVQGFVNFCKEIDPLRVEVVRDWMIPDFDYDDIHYSDKTMRAVAMLFTELEKAGVNVRPVVFPNNYKEKLQRYL